PPVRNEIIPVKSKNEKKALRDANGDLLQAFFVNNAAACPGLGTFESPFCTLAQASTAPAGALIYVFEGNSVASPYQGFTMNFGQTLQGSGTPLAIDGVTIPAQTSGMPHVDTIEITVASSATVQGFFINAHDLAAGIQGNNVSDVRILNNVIINSMQHGIWFPYHTGSLYIAGNRVSDSLANGISIDMSGPGLTQVINNTLANSGSSGVLVRLNDPNSIGLVQGNRFINNLGFDIGSEAQQGVLTIDSNIMNSPAAFNAHALDGIQYFTNNRVTNTANSTLGLSYDITNAGTGPRHAYFYNNQVTMLGTGGVGIISHTYTVPGTIYTEVVNNTSTSATPANGIIVETFTGPSSVCASITGNTSSGIRMNGSMGPVNLQQTQVQYQTDNNVPTVSSGAVNFGSSCTP
ncbi:MAG TPA: right-handed parallel beta-helix repeat-containing protein, partial [Rhabdochlamydiaceae bacterium]|nr:right-handed parallel beta-helix repeat-containing protein [Rhabdochlamydiaceae bacterium]